MAKSKKQNKELLDDSTEYDEALRSIGSRYGEINSVYKEGEKILDITRENINGILSLTALLKTQNADIIPLVLATQQGYKGITSSIVKSIGSLEDSESLYKSIGLSIDEQEKSVVSLGAQLEELTKNNPENLLPMDLKRHLSEQVDALSKMRNAADGVRTKLEGISKAGQVLGSTPIGGFVDDILAGTKQLMSAFGIELPGSISDLLESSKRGVAQGGLNKIESASKNKKENEDSITTLADSIKDSATPVADSIKDSATPVADSIKESVTPVVDSIKESATPLVETKTQTINAIAESMQQQGRTPNESIQESITPVEPPEIKLPGQIETKISTEPLEKEQTAQSKKSTNLLSNLSRTGQRAARKVSKKAQLSAGKVKEADTKIPQPDQTSIDNSKETTNVTNVTNVGDAATPAVESGTKPLQDVADSIASPISQELKTETTDYSDRVRDSGTDAMGSLATAGESVIKGAELAGAAGAGGGAAGALAAAGPYVAAAAGIYMLGKAAVEAARYFDSLEDATDTLARGMTSTGNKFAFVQESIGDLSAPIGQLGGTDIQQEVKGTKEYRQLVFDFSVGQAVKQRQALTEDYFNFEKQNYTDLVGYQQSLTTDTIDYEIGLQRDAINFRFQQESANLDAELEKRKTLAGSAMKFIGNYAKVSERALNAIGSSTKAIMDGMKQFGAILGGTTKQQFSLIENAQGLSYSYGASADQVLNISHMFKLLGNTTENIGMGLVEGIKGLVGPTGNVQAVFNEIVEASADIYRLMSATPNEIAKQTVALQKAGVKLSSMLKASDTMVLNYKDSIKAEMSLGAMIGRNVSFNEARARLMSGDMVGAANAIRQSLGGIDVNQLNPFAKQELTKATGLQLDQIIQLQQTGKIETEGDKQLKQAKLTGKAIADGVLSQDIANAGAKLALEQKQRKEMLEFEQRVRLLNLGVEQAKRLQMIPIEAAYRAKYAEDIQFKQEVDNMVLGVLKEGLTGTFSSINVEQYKQIGNQMMGAYGLPTNPAAVGGPNMVAGIAQLQTTLTNLNANIPSIVSVTDPKYAQYMAAQFKMGEDYRSEVSKKGVTDEEKNKIALKYKDKATQLYNTSFASEIQTTNQQQQQAQNKKDELNKKLISLNADADISKINKEFNKFNTDENEIINTLKKYKTQEEFELFTQQYKEKTGKKLDKQILDTFNYGEAADLDTYLKTVGYTSAPVNGDISIQKTKNTGTPLPGQFNVQGNSNLPVTTNTIVFQQGPDGTLPPTTASYGTGFQQGPVGNGTYTPPGGQSFPTGFNTYTPPTTTPPPGGETVSNEKNINNQVEVVKVLNKIQSEAHSRGITIHTEQKTTTAYIKSSAEKLHYAKVAVEGTKMDSTKLVEKGIPSTQNLEQISIEMIKELQVANELLAGVVNNTQPAEGGIVLNLDGKKLATNFQNRMNNRQAFNNANRTRTNP
jgi:hypothetical protein